LILTWLCALAFAEISVEPVPRVGTESAIVVVDEAGRPAAGETVRVLHRPGMAGEREIAIGITDTRGKVLWTPEIPGLSTVRAGAESKTLRVERVHWPAGVLTLLLLLVASALVAIASGLFYPRRFRVRP